MLVTREKIEGAWIEIHDDRIGRRHYWVKVDGLALFQRGRMRIRAFATIDAARKAACKEAKSTASKEAKNAAVEGKAGGVPGYSNFGGSGPFAPMSLPKGETA